MARRLCRGLAACAALNVASLAVRTLRADPLGPILLSYDAPEGCPDVGQFQRKVEQRSSQIRFVDEGSHQRELSIRLSQVRDHTIGELRLIERDGTLRQRSVRFSSCAEAVEGLALITAVSLDPQALAEPASPAQLAPTPSTPTAAQPAPTQPALAPAKPTPPPPPPVVPKPRQAATPPLAEPVTASNSGFESAWGAEFETASAITAAPALGGALFFDLASKSRSWVSPFVRLALSHLERRGVTVPNSSAEGHFALTLGILSVCPLQWDARAFVLRPCALVNAGALHSWASQASDPRSATKPFVSWGGSGLILVPVSPVFDLFAEAGANAALLEYQFDFDQSLVLTTPERYLSTGIGFRLRLR